MRPRLVHFVNLLFLCSLPSLGSCNAHGRELRRSLFEEEPLQVKSPSEDDYQIQMRAKKLKQRGKRSDDVGQNEGDDGESVTRSNSGSERKKSSGSGVGGGGGGERAGKWKQNLALLQKYHKKHKDAKVPIDYEDGEVKLGRWLKAIKKAWQNGKLTDEKGAALEELGLTKDGVGAVKTEQQRVGVEAFEKFSEALTAYAEEKGNINLPRNYETAEGLRLGGWKNSVLLKAKKGQIPEERLILLRKLWAKLGADFERESESMGDQPKGTGGKVSKTSTRTSTTKGVSNGDHLETGKEIHASGGVS